MNLLINKKQCKKTIIQELTTFIFNNFNFN